MNYLTQRSVYYYFLMREAAETGLDSWSFIAKNFGVKPKEIKTYEAMLKNRVLDELSAPCDIEMYKNYLNGFCTANSEFGKRECEREIIDVKALALHKVQELFSNSAVKGNRLRSLSHTYWRDHIASVLYAMQMLYLNDDEQCGRLAKQILIKELKEGKNSDAGILLLKLKEGDAAETVTRLRGLPDMLLMPDMLKYLERQYGKSSGESIFTDERKIGFGGGTK